MCWNAMNIEVIEKGIKGSNHFTILWASPSVAHCACQSDADHCERPATVPSLFPRAFSAYMT